MRLRLVLPVVLLLLLFACSRAAQKRGARMAAGDAIWFTDGVLEPSGELEGRLGRLGCALLFLPARVIRAGGAGWAGEDAPPPPSPFSRTPVVLIVRATQSFDSALARQDAGERLWREIDSALRRRELFGKAAGLHLDLPFSASAAEAFAGAAEFLRKKLPADLFLSVSLRWAPAPRDREKLAALASRVDALVAFVFGPGNRADPVSADSLQKPWWPAYAPGARGLLTNESGELLGGVPERFLNPLTEDPRIEFRHELRLAESSEPAFSLRAREPFRSDGLTLQEGDQVSYSQPELSSMLSRLGGDLAGRRHLRGRVFVLEGRSDADRLFPLPALEDVLLGRALAPDLRLTVEEEAPGALRVAAENLAPHSTAASRVSNWVEVDVPADRIEEIQLGGFDRYEVFDSSERPVSLGRATRVRFYETLLAPFERVEPAHIRVRGQVPAACCRTRSRIVAAAGLELAADWSEPPPTAPEETPAKKR